MGVGATIDYEAEAVKRAPALDDPQRPRMGLSNDDRAAPLLATLHADARILLAGAARPPRPLPAAILHLAGRRATHSSSRLRARSTGADVERILFGDNQFFGINHLSEEKARQQAMKFQDVGAFSTCSSRRWTPA